MSESFKVFMDFKRCALTLVTSHDWGVPTGQPSALAIYHTCPICRLLYVGTNPRFDWCPQCGIPSIFMLVEYRWTREEIEREARKCNDDGLTYKGIRISWVPKLGGR